MTIELTIWLVQMMIVKERLSRKVWDGDANLVIELIKLAFLPICFQLNWQMPPTHSSLIFTNKKEL